MATLDNGLVKALLIAAIAGCCLTGAHSAVVQSVGTGPNQSLNELPAAILPPADANVSVFLTLFGVGKQIYYCPAGGRNNGQWQRLLPAATMYEVTDTCKGLVATSPGSCPDTSGLPVGYYSAFTQPLIDNATVPHAVWTLFDPASSAAGFTGVNSNNTVDAYGLDSVEFNFERIAVTADSTGYEGPSVPADNVPSINSDVSTASVPSGLPSLKGTKYILRAFTQGGPIPPPGCVPNEIVMNPFTAYFFFWK